MFTNMCKNLDYDTINNYIKQREWKNLAENLKTNLALEMDSNGEPKKYHQQVVEFLQKLLPMCLEDENMREFVLIEVLRGLRNSVTDKKIQESLLNENFMVTLQKMYVKIKDNDIFKPCTKVMMQVLINLSVNNPQAAKLIYNHFNDLANDFENESNVYEVSALLHYISLHEPIKHLNFNLVNKIVELYHKEEKCEFLHFLLETICRYDYFWSFYNDLEIDTKLTILGIIKEKQVKENEVFFVKEGLDVMVKIFIDSSQTIFMSSDTKKASEVSMVLQILSQVTGSSQNFLEILQSNSDLLIQAAILLINIHRLGKTDNNCFTDVPKLADVSEDFKENPAYGFKGDLVRFIGNLNWMCKKMQDLVNIIPTYRVTKTSLILLGERTSNISIGEKSFQKKKKTNLKLNLKMFTNMCKNLDYDTINNYIKQREWKNLAENLKTNLALEMDSNGEPKKYHQQVVEFLQKLLPMCLEDENMREFVLIEVLRGLRNSVTDKKIQESLLNENFMVTLQKMYVKIKDNDIFKPCTKVMMQVLINLSVNNPQAAKLIYNHFNDLANDFENESNVYEVSALLHYISLHEPIKHLNFNLVNKIVELYHKEEKCEFLHFLLETICRYDYFWSFYNDLEIDTKLTILGIIKEKQVKENEVFFVKEGLDVMVKIFIDSSQTIFMSSDTKKASEVSMVLQILSQVTGSSQNFLEILQSNSDLLIQAAILLINIHRLGKTDNNCFTDVPKLADVSEDFKENPAYGFKGDLVRFIGNLNWMCKKMQDLTREAELIPVILECCNIDEKNPFIMQWAIFAIRNICKNNVKNQKFIALMEKQGTVDNDTLNQVGLTLSNDGDKSIGIVNLDDIRKS